MTRYLQPVGGLLMTVGAVLPLIVPEAAPWTFGTGALLFGLPQMLARPEGANLTLRRLYRQQQMAALLLLLTATLMFADSYGPWRLGSLWITGGEWKMFLLLAAVIETYTAFRISAVEKEK